MEEENKTEEETSEEEKPEEETPQPQSNLLEDARTATKEMKEQLDRREKLIEREEALAAQNMIGGKADAGQAPEPKKKMSNEEYTRYIEKHGRAPDEAKTGS